MIQLLPGDGFVVAPPEGQANLPQNTIKVVSRWRSSDNDALYVHAGIIVSPNGKTFEARVRYCYGNLFRDYDGCRVLIARHCDMTLSKHADAFERIKPMAGLRYPFLRFPAQISTYAAKLIPMREDGKYMMGPVCSELYCLYGKYAGLRELHYCKGITPDHLADAFAKFDVFEPIYEGVLPDVF